MSKLGRSPWIMHYDAASCNGCDIEVLACLTPVYDVERLGVINTGNPKHADILLITGGVNNKCAEVVKQIYVPATAVCLKTLIISEAVLIPLFLLMFMYPAVRQDPNPLLTVL